jgi:hypothetical protein
MKTTLAVLAVSALAVCPLRAEVVKGEAAAQHPTTLALVEFTKLMKAGKPDEAGKFQSARARAKRAARTAADRKESDAFIKDFLPAPDALIATIQKSGSLAIEGDTATLSIYVSTSTKNADGSVTASTDSMGFLFARENGEWRVDQ